MSAPSACGTVITVVRGGCEVVCEGASRELRLTGKSALHGVELAVGDQVDFDLTRAVVLGVRERRTELRRRRPRDDPRQSHVIAANVDRLAIVASVRSPPFRAGLVDRFQLAAYAGGLDAILVCNKIDLLEGDALPEEIQSFEAALPVVAVSAKTGEGLDRLDAELRGRSTVFCGHSGVGKSSLLNALHPELRLETGDLIARSQRGRHTTRSSIWLRLSGGAVVIDTPGVRELASGSIDPELVERAYPDVLERAGDCRFRDCHHDREPDCAVTAAVAAGELSRLRYQGYRKLVSEIAEDLV